MEEAFTKTFWRHDGRLAVSECATLSHRPLKSTGGVRWLFLLQIALKSAKRKRKAGAATRSPDKWGGAHGQRDLVLNTEWMEIQNGWSTSSASGAPRAMRCPVTPIAWRGQLSMRPIFNGSCSNSTILGCLGPGGRSRSIIRHSRSSLSTTSAGKVSGIALSLFGTCISKRSDPGQLSFVGNDRAKG